MRRFVLVANRASTDPTTPLNDLPGMGGRFDLVTRFVTSTLLVSHGVRKDTTCYVVLGGPPNAPRALRLDGSHVIGVRPDERATAAKLLQALAPFATPLFQATKDGIDLARFDLAAVLDRLDGPVYLLDEGGDPARGADLPSDATYIIGDDQGLTPEQDELVRKRANGVLSLGPVPLQADQCAVVLHNLLDQKDQARHGV